MSRYVSVAKKINSTLQTYSQKELRDYRKLMDRYYKRPEVVSNEESKRRHRERTKLWVKKNKKRYLENKGKWTKRYRLEGRDKQIEVSKKYSKIRKEKGVFGSKGWG